jgi:glycosyltransferase involved in cell wall biosynthesis
MGRSVYAISDPARTEESFVSSASGLLSSAGEEVRKTFGSARTRPLRVLTLTPFFPSAEDPCGGGFIAEPLAAMKSFGVSNQVIAAQPFYGCARSAGNSEVLWENYFSIPGNVGLPLAGKFLAARLMPGIIEKHCVTPFDVIHAHAALPCGHAAAMVGKRLSIPFVVSVHGLDAFFTRQSGLIFGSWCEHVAKIVYRSAGAVICISEKVSEQVTSTTHANVTVVYNGVDVDKFFPEKEWSAHPRVLSVGNLIAIKGHALLLRAFARVLRVIPDCSLEIIGDGPERGRLDQLAAKLGIANRVHFSGRKGRDYVAESMRRCSMFVLPSTYEGLGCVYLEAMACAKPAIGCWGQGIEEIIEHRKTGMLVTPGNEADLTDAMLNLLRDENLRQRVGTNARELVLARLTLNHQAEQLAEVYRRAAR